MVARRVYQPGPERIPLTQQPPLRLIVLMPLRDDWASAAELIRRLDKTISCDACTMEILLVDDGSVQKCDRNDFQNDFSVVRTIRTLRLRRDLGHQARHRKLTIPASIDADQSATSPLGRVGRPGFARS